MDALFDNQGKLPSTMRPQESSSQSIRLINLDQITPSKHQPRTLFDEDKIESLAASIKSHGVIQPIVLMKEEDKNIFKIIAGERRWRAAKIAGLKKIPAIVKTYEQEQASLIALIENIQREDLNPLERARAVQELATKHQLRQQELATHLGVSRTYLTNTLRLLKLSESCQKALLDDEISEGHAKILCAHPQSFQQKMLKVIKAKKLSVRGLEDNIRQIDLGQTEGRLKRPIEPTLRPVIEFFEEFFGTRASIKDRGKNKGEVVLYYNSHEELEGMIDKLGSDVENRL